MNVRYVAFEPATDDNLYRFGISTSRIENAVG